ncbi:hypothetical protein A2U01_0100956, partial [Trifolium medium]|nr:hypothetical protein [Trifolium medium]
MYGKPPPSIPAYITGTSPVDACDAVLTTRDEHYKNTGHLTG